LIDFYLFIYFVGFFHFEFFLFFGFFFWPGGTTLSLMANTWIFAFILALSNLLSQILEPKTTAQMVYNCANGTATCNYTGPGTFTCACNSGYSGNGVNCTGQWITNEITHPKLRVINDSNFQSLSPLQILMNVRIRRGTTAALRLAPTLQDPSIAPALLDLMGTGPPALITTSV